MDVYVAKHLYKQAIKRAVRRYVEAHICMRKDNRILGENQIVLPKSQPKSDVYADECPTTQNETIRQEVKESEFELFSFFSSGRASSCRNFFTVLIILVSIGCDSARLHL